MNPRTRKYLGTAIVAGLLAALVVILLTALLGDPSYAGGTWSLGGAQ